MGELSVFDLYDGIFSWLYGNFLFRCVLRNRRWRKGRGFGFRFVRRWIGGKFPIIRIHDHSGWRRLRRYGSAPTRIPPRRDSVGSRQEPNLESAISIGRAPCDFVALGIIKTNPRASEWAKIVKITCARYLPRYSPPNS
jgi:hypothetical protein